MATFSMFGTNTRIHTSGDEEGCKAYLGEANRALYQLRVLNQTGEFALPERKFSDGTVLKVWAAGGFDYVDIHKPIFEGKEEKVEFPDEFFPAYYVQGGCVRADWKTLEPIEFLSDGEGYWSYTESGGWFYNEPTAREFRPAAELPDNCVSTISVNDDTLYTDTSSDYWKAGYVHSTIMDEEETIYQESSTSFESYDGELYLGVRTDQGQVSNSGIFSELMGGANPPWNAGIDGNGVKCFPKGDPAKNTDRPWYATYWYLDGTFFFDKHKTLGEVNKLDFECDGVMSVAAQGKLVNSGETEVYGNSYTKVLSAYSKYFSSGSVKDYSRQSTVVGGDYINGVSFNPYKLHYDVDYNPDNIGGDVYNPDGSVDVIEDNKTLFKEDSFICVSGAITPLSVTINYEQEGTSIITWDLKFPQPYFAYYLEYFPGTPYTGGSEYGYVERYDLIDPKTGKKVARTFVGNQNDGVYILEKYSYTELFIAYKMEEKS